MFKTVDPKPNFPEMEKRILSWWYRDGIVNKYLHRNDPTSPSQTRLRGASQRFSFLDGPITANNPMGVHHGWSRTYKDVWQRYFNMKGYQQRFQNGFDCQGLWVEVEVEKELRFKSKKDIEKYGIGKFVEKCKERVRHFAAIQTEQSKRLGYFMDWDHSYYTMDDENNYMIWYFLKKCHEFGWIYKGHDSVPWCPRCETAISQHEMLTEDYQELTHESIILKFPLKGRKNEFLLVWTTTPWTIPANIAVAVDKNIDYCLVEGNDGGLFWIAKNLAEKVFKDRLKRIVETVKGGKLVGLGYSGAFDHLEAVKKAAKTNPDQFHTVIATDDQIMPISAEEGTGLVHTAVSAGEEDFKLGKKYGLPMIPVVGDNADYLPGLGEFSGKNAKNNPRLILDYLAEREKTQGNCVFEIFSYTHRYPACWRCKTELVWKVADEWYIAMDVSPLQVQSSKILPRRQAGKVQRSKKENRTLRERMIEVAKQIKWIPEFGLERELDWLTNMHDWLISKKNRYWGLALPIYECSKCKTFEVIGSYEELEKRAVEGWDKFAGNSPHKPWIDDVKIKCVKCNQLISRIEDVGNPWLDAGIVSFSTLIDPQTKKLSYISDKRYWQEWFPADFITESFPGQFKNWFYSLIAMATVLEDRAPFKTVLGFATLLGEDGRPMHKSWGNSIEFNEAADKIGVDVMRWMYVTANPVQNILFGYKNADETRRKFHLLLWNIYNFFVTYANADGWEPKKSQISNLKSQIYKLTSNNILDRWIISKLHRLIKIVTDSLDKYDAQTASLAIEKFVNDFSTWYVRRSRNRTDSGRYQTMYEVLITLTKLLTPFTPYLAEEIYKNLTGKESVHLDIWPTADNLLIDSDLEEKMDYARKIVEMAHAQRKINKIKVRQPLQKLKIQNAKFKLNNETVQLIKEEVNIKEVEILPGPQELKVELDCRLSQDLILEGQARDIIRQIQLKRKELGCDIKEEVTVRLPFWPAEFTGHLKKETLAKEIIKGEKFSVERS